MIKELHADMFNIRADAYVNPVNCVGTAGAGLAKDFRGRFPCNHSDYVEICKSGLMRVGMVFTSQSDWQTGTLKHNGEIFPRYVINLPTKRHWRDNSRLDDVVSGVDALRDEVLKLNLSSIVVPALGCGYGGLRWEDVAPVIRSALSDVDALVYLVPPLDARTQQVKRRQKRESGAGVAQMGLQLDDTR